MNSIYHTLKLDRNIPIPLYYQLKQFMMDNINNNTLKEGESVPTEEELCNLLNISRPTVRQAFSELVSEGYLKRLKAKGTFISKPQVDGKFFQKIESFNSEMKALGLTPSTRLLSAQIIQSDEDISRVFNFEVGNRVVYLERVRYANDDPMVYVETYLPAEQFESIINDDLENHSLYEILETKYSTKLSHVKRTIQADLSDEFLSNLLSVPENSAILFVRTIGYDVNELPVEYSIAQYGGNRNKFTLELYRE